jgi:uncharacterized membrane protein
MAGPLELIVAAFDDAERAAQVLEELRDLERSGDLALVNVALLVKDAEGRAQLKETGDVRAPGGALFGAIVGGLVGLLGGPAGAIVGAAAGAATGGLAAHSLDLGFDDTLLKEIQDGLPAGSSAIIALIAHEWVERLISKLEALEARLYRQALKAEILAQLPPKTAAGPGQAPAAPAQTVPDDAQPSEPK